MEKAGNLTVLLESNIKAITTTCVAIEKNGKIIEQKNDAVIICAGGVLPTPLLKKIGIDVDTKYGTA